MRSGEEIQSALRAFVAKWQDYIGSEKAEAQTFLNELVDCYGLDRHAAGMLFEHHLPRVGFVDMFWPGRALFEMKRPSGSAQLEQAQPQAERYWRASEAPDGSYDAVRYVVLCSFQRLLVWDMRRPSRPAANLSLDELPDHYEALGFLLGADSEASFIEHHRVLTLEAAESISTLYWALVDRAAAPLDELRRFVLQCVWTMFAEDLQMLRGYPLQTIVNRLLRERAPSTARDIGWLFTVLNQKGAQNRKGELEGTTYVNGELFASPASVELTQQELGLLVSAAQFDWRRVDPTIFGSLMEGVLGRERRWEVGAHYTHEVDIMKIVEPTIVRPWRARIEGTTSPQQARDLLDELCAFRVLDPACGCGNFLYVAYRELRSLEAELKARIRSLAVESGLPEPAGSWPHVRVANMQGIDIERVSVLITRVTLWMGHRQMIERFGEAEPPLPLVPLTGIQAADALRAPWPETDCIIGNPPFQGSQLLRGSLGDEYVEWLRREFGVGIKDFCVYWFRRAQDHLLPGQRAGLVGTNSVSQNRARSASLAYLLQGGSTITDAVSSQKWPGEAKVHVSIVNWRLTTATPAAGPVYLDGVRVDAIDASLRVANSGSKPRVLSRNGLRCFQGPIPASAGFVLSATEAADLIYRDPRNVEVVRPYLIGDDIAHAPEQSASRWIIDFASLTLQEASRYESAMQIVRERVKPDRDRNRDKGFREKWWQFGRPRGEMRQALIGLSRWAAGGRVGKRLFVAWQDKATCPSDLTNVFIFEDDFSMGVLLSATHNAWAWEQSSTLETRLRYTPSTVFETFSWAGAFASELQRRRVAKASRELLARRTEICLSEQIGLTKLYNAVDEGSWADLKALHRELDEAVADCYGWPRSVAQDDADLVRRLTELNREIVEGRVTYDPFAYLAD